MKARPLCTTPAAAVVRSIDASMKWLGCPRFGGVMSEALKAAPTSASASEEPRCASSVHIVTQSDFVILVGVTPFFLECALLPNMREATCCVCKLKRQQCGTLYSGYCQGCWALWQLMSRRPAAHSKLLSGIRCVD